MSTSKGSKVAGRAAAVKRAKKAAPDGTPPSLVAVAGTTVQSLCNDKVRRREGEESKYKTESGDPGHVV
ncbi:MAG: hypothetical protein M1812_000390 [Candelaria pacifica]|nr:MAG: hypothetical protein M1812_000390 [Candelaria pacifica]